MTRYKLTLEYDGTNLIGWQVNKDGPSVQSLVTDAIYQFCGERVDVVGAGRTDAGVHAMAMIAHVNIEKETDADTVMNAVNFYLKHANAPVVVLNCTAVSDEFHARFSATKRRYRYAILCRRAPAVMDANRVWWMPRELDVDAMKSAAAKLIGNHDFTSFRASECQAKSPVKTLDSIDVATRVEEFGTYVFIDVAARSFLHHMVRNIVGTLVEIGHGKDMDIEKILGARDRSAAGPTAPASGLYFMGAEYSNNA